MRSPTRFLLALFAGTSPAALAGAAHAQAVTDGTAGAATTLPGSDFLVAHTLGTTSGANLFHSFTSFDIVNGGSATFTGPAGYDNVISRVTGGDISNIDGALISTIPGADFYFINPAGVTFGAGASVNVPAGFHVSTADRLTFANTDVLLASTGPGSTFSSAAPASFGFLGANAGVIVIDGATLGSGAETSAFDFTAAGIDHQSGVIETSGPFLRLVATGNGSVEIDVAGGAPVGALQGDVSIAGNVNIHADGVLLGPAQRLSIYADVLTIAGAEVRSFAGLTDVGPSIWLEANSFEGTAGFIRTSTGQGPGGDLALTFSDSASFGDFLIQTGTLGGPAGDFTVRGGDYTLTNTNWASGTGGASNASNIDIEINSLSLSGSVIQSGSGGSGAAGDIDINVATEASLYRSTIFGGISSSGAAGAVSIAGPTITMEDSYFGLGAVATATSPVSGQVTVSGDDITLIGHTSYNPFNLLIADAHSGVQAATGGQANGGDVFITATNSLHLVDAYVVTVTFGVGDAGNISLNAPQIDIDGDSLVSSTALAPATGNGGSVAITSDTLTVNTGRISATTESDGNAGTIAIIAGLTALNGGSIDSSTYAAGDGGSISIFGDRVENTSGFIGSEVGNGNVLAGEGGSITLMLTDAYVAEQGGYILSQTHGGGNAGDITITAPTVSLTDSVIGAGVNGGSGSGGTLTINADTMTLASFSEVRASTFDAGHGGNIDLNISGLLEVESSEIANNAESSGDAGNTTIDADIIRLLDDGKILARAQADGDAGSISINALTSFFTSGGSDVLAITAGAGTAGSITITAPDIQITDDTAVEASTFGSGAGGSLSLFGDTILLQNSGLSTGSVDAGNANNLTLTATTSIDLLRAGVTAGTDYEGNAGSVRLTAPTINVIETAVIAGTGPDATGAGGNIIVNGGDLTIAGVAPDVFDLDTETDALPGGLDTTTFGASDGGNIEVTLTGTLRIEDGAAISASSEGGGDGGSITITAPTIELIKTPLPPPSLTPRIAITSNATGAGAAGTITINADALLADAAGVTANTSGSGRGGNVVINADETHLTNGSLVASRTAADGIGGQVRINGDLLESHDSNIVADTNGSGQGGSIVIDVGSFVQTFSPGLGYLGLSTNTFGTGNGGAITINADLVQLTRGSISSSVFNEGDGGNISITADVIEMNESSFIQGSGGFFSGGVVTSIGNSGSVQIRARELNMDGASIATNTTGPGAGGAIGIVVDEQATLLDSSIVSGAAPGSTGAAGAITLSASTLDMTFSNIVSDTEGPFDGHQAATGNAGDITLDVGTINIFGAGSGGGFGASSTASISSRTRGIGDAGDIVINGQSLLVSGFGGLLALISTETEGDGDAGDVRITVDDVTLRGGGRIAANGGFGNEFGSAGGVIIVADNLTMDGATSPIFDGASIIAQGGGPLAHVTIDVSTLSLDNGAYISTESEGGGPAADRAGPINITADSILLDNGSSLESITDSGGDAGSIEINAGSLELRNGSTVLTIAAVAEFIGPSAGQAGDITIAADTIVISGVQSTGPDSRSHSNIGAFAGPGAGAAGDVHITAGNVSLLDGGMITAFSNNQFAGGTVTIDAAEVVISGGAPVSFAGTAAEFGARILIEDFGLNSALITDTFATGAAGTIVVRAQNISFIDGGVARTNTSSSGQGGTIIICPDGTLLIVGQGSALVANSSEGSTGNAGVIGVQAGAVVLEDGGRVTVASAGSGRGGQVIVQTHTFDMTNAGGAGGAATAINTLVSGAAASGSVEGAGQVAILAGVMNVVGGSVVTTDTTGAAPAGRIVIRAGELNIQGTDTLVSSASTSNNRGNAGVIDIAARNLTIDGARISTLSESGSGGQVILSVDEQLVLNAGEITTQVRGSTSDSNAGDIYIGRAATNITIDNPCQGVCTPFDPFRFVSAPSATDGVPAVLVNEGGRIVGSADVGRGGEVVIVADNIVNNGVIQSDPGSGIDVESVSGIDGTTSVTGATFTLPNFVIAPDTDFRSMCEAQQRGLESSFTEALGAQPYDPTALRFAPYADQRAPSGAAASCADAEDVVANLAPPRRRWFEFGARVN